MRSFTVLLGLILVFGFSVFAQKGKIEIMETGAFHGEEISAKTGENWLGLYKQKENYSLLPVVITVESVQDPILDNDEGEKTGKEIKVLGQEHSVFLIRGGSFAQSRAVKTVFGGEKLIENDFDENFDFEGRKYNLKVESQSRNQQYPKLLDPTSKLVLSEGKTRQIIYSDGGCADCGWHLNWAGDLDGDGKLDFYMYLTNHYNVAYMKLFLSSGAESGKLVKESAEFRYVGC